MKETGKVNNDDLFRSSGCFQKLVPEEFEYISTRKKQVVYQKGETICKQGAFAPYVLYVIDGLVKVTLEMGRNRQKNISLLKSGDFIAFATVFGESVYNYTTQALRESIICMIDKDALKKLLYENNEFAYAIVSRNYHGENHLLEIIKNITHKQMPGKLASTLLYLGSDEFAGEQVFENLSRQDIADFAGITVESTVKLLKEFEQNGLLEIDRKQIRISNRDTLKEISLRG